MDSENSACKSILMKNWTACTELVNEQKINSNKNKATIAGKKIQALQQIGEGFVKYICSGYELENAEPSHIIGEFGQRNELKGIEPKILLGFSLHAELMKIDAIKTINSMLNYIVGNLTKCSVTQSFQVSLSDSGQDPFQTSNFYAKSNQPTHSSASQIQVIFDNQSEKDEDLNISINLQEEGQNYNSDYIKHQNQQVKQYLYKLSKSTTELSYLCQRMKWAQPTFVERKSGVNQILFSCQAEVMVRSKDKCYSLTAWCAYAVSKKQAKRVAALFLLRKIYNRFPDSWTKFKINRQQNPGIQQALNANNEQMFRKANFQILNINIFKNQKNEDTSDQLNKQINEYLDGIKSFKGQVNLLIGRQKKITPPQIQRQKMDELSLWPVTITLFDGETQLKAQGRDSSKKGAEQKCCRDLLFEIYTRNPHRWIQFAKYKKLKNLQ